MPGAPRRSPKLRASPPPPGRTPAGSHAPDRTGFAKIRRIVAVGAIRVISAPEIVVGVARPMRLLLPPPRHVAAILLTIALASCGGSKDEAYIEKPVDDLYNKAMDALVAENYAAAAKTFDQV